MALFDSFRQPKWQHRNPEKRKQAVSELTDPQILFGIVCEDPDPAVQATALGRIDRAAMLDELMGRKLAPALLSQARRQRLSQLLPQAEALGTISDEVALLHIIQLSEDAGITAAAIERIENEETLARLARQHPQARARLQAAQRIGDTGILNQLMQDSRGHDKAVFRHCKNVLDELHARERDAAEQQAKIRRLLERMEQLATALDSPVYEGQYRSLVQEWRGVESAADAGQKAAFQRHQAVCGQRLIEQRDARLEAERNQAETEAAQQQFAGLAERLDETEAALATPQDEAALAEFRRGTKELEAAWQQAAAVSPAPAGLESRFKARLQRWKAVAATVESLLERDDTVNSLLAAGRKADARNYALLEKQIAATGKFLARLPWPEAIPLQEPQALSRLRACQQQLQQQLRTLEQEQQKLAKRLGELVGQISSALEQQQPGEADKAMGKARKLLPALAPQPRQQVEQQLAPLSARLHEFHDWQNFAIEPKKEALVERMSALIGQADDVELLALNIQSLQAEWKQLGPLPHAREQDLWNQFKAAADEAWKPCKEEFRQQAEIRKQNFAERMKLVEQLQAYEQQMHWPDEAHEPGSSGPAPDWQLVQKTLDAARAAFRAVGPLEPKAERTSQKAFKEVCDRVYSHIRAEYQRNIDRKQDLLDRARALVEHADLQHAINTVKVLQADWTATGITPVAVDRKLWKEFRASCDAIFARLDQQKQAEKQETDALVREAEALRDQARALLENPDPGHLVQLPRSIAELQATMAAISLPGPVQQALKKQMQGMENQARELFNQQRRAQQQQAWTNLFEALRAGSAADTSQQGDSTREGLLANLPAGIDAAAISSFLDTGPAPDAEEACRSACIALEVFGELESPPADRQARMNYQLGRLAQGLGQQLLEPEQELLGHINAFVALRPGPPWVERFCAGLQQIRA